MNHPANLGQIIPWETGDPQNSPKKRDRWPDLAEILAASQLDARDNGAPSECQGGNPQVRMVDFREDMHPKKNVIMDEEG